MFPFELSNAMCATDVLKVVIHSAEFGVTQDVIRPVSTGRPCGC